MSKLLITFVCGVVFLGAVIFASVYFLSSIDFELLPFQYPKEHEEIVNKYAEKYNVDSNLIFAVIRTESSFDKNAESHVGAKGLMQIMPETFTWLQEKKGLDSSTYSEDDLLNPEINIEYGTYFLSILLNEYKAEVSAIAAYNAGFVVSDWLNNPEYSVDGVNLTKIPYEETSNYVERVITTKKKYQKIK